MFIKKIEFKQIRATAKENIHHAYKTGLLKVNYGSTLSDLTEKQVLEIRRLWKDRKLKQIQIAKQFNVGKNCIWCIVNRKTWTQI